jgi:nucleotide-binding universal stress UspA family protein
MSPSAPSFAQILCPIDFSEASDAAIRAGTAERIGPDHDVEFGDATARAVASALALAQVAGGRVRFVHATPNMQMHGGYGGPAGLSVPAQILKELHDAARDSSLRAMQALVQRVRSATPAEGVAVEYVARAGGAAEVLLAEAHELPADVIVMAASGRGAVARFFVGSTADRIIREAPCPVLVLPAHAQRA